MDGREFSSHWRWQLLNYCFGMKCISTRLVHNDTVFPKRSRQRFFAFFLFLKLIFQRPSLPQPCERLASDRSSLIPFACVWHCYPAQRDQSKDSSPQSMFKGSISFKVFGYKLTLVIEISDRDSDDIFDRHSKVRRFLYIGSWCLRNVVYADMDMELQENHVTPYSNCPSSSFTFVKEYLHGK